MAVKTCSVAAALLLIAADAAFAQLVVGCDTSGNASIYDINVTTGVAAAIYTSSGFEAKPWGMAYDPVKDTLYWNNGARLYRSPMGSQLQPVELGFIEDFIAPPSLAFQGGRLLCTTVAGTKGLYGVDVNTLASTLLFTYPAEFNFVGLDTDSVTNRIYAVSTPTPGFRGLYEFNLGGGAPAFVAPFPANEQSIQAVAVHQGTAYLIAPGPATVHPTLYIMDVATGAHLGTIPTPFAQGGSFAGATFAQPLQSCYPDCNGDAALGLADFGCFTTKFALGDPYADCNEDTALNLADFGCFQTKFALGCP